MAGLLTTLVMLAFLFARTEWFFTQLILLLLLVFQVYDLVRLVNRTNQALSRFLLAIRHADYSAKFGQESEGDPSVQNLQRAFDEVIASFQKMERQKESQFLFFKRIIECVHTGILVLSPEKDLVLVNQAAQRLLNLPGLRSWTHLKTSQPDFATAIGRLHSTGRVLLELSHAGETRQLSVGADPVIVLGAPHLIITLQDIRSQIEQKETEAWHKLIRILSHEVMNSVTPVVSLTDTMRMILEDEEARPKRAVELTEENLSDLRFSLQTIRKRSHGMLHFIHDYRQLTHLPVPQLEKVNVGELIENAARLMQGELRIYQIRLRAEVPVPNLSIQADTKMIEQVLINLLTNSLQALAGVHQPLIQVSSFPLDNQVIIEVRDNGPGIEPDKLDKIFVPFYSTKENGSGIGLSLSRQIMKLHQGTIRVRSEKGVKTCFRLHFPQTG